MRFIVISLLFISSMVSAAPDFLSEAEVTELAKQGPMNSKFANCSLCTDDQMKVRALELAKFHNDESEIHAVVFNARNNKVITFRITDQYYVQSVESSEFSKYALSVKVFAIKELEEKLRALRDDDSPSDDSPSFGSPEDCSPRPGSVHSEC